MNELRDKFKKAAEITLFLLYLVAAFVCGYCIAKESGDRGVGKAMLDVYRGKTTLEITYRDSVAIDSTVVYKVKNR